MKQEDNHAQKSSKNGRSETVVSTENAYVRESLGREKHFSFPLR